MDNWSNQKSQGGRMDKNKTHAQAIYKRPTSDQNTQTESEEMVKNISYKQK